MAMASNVDFESNVCISEMHPKKAVYEPCRKICLKTQPKAQVYHRNLVLSIVVIFVVSAFAFTDSDCTGISFSLDGSRVSIQLSTDSSYDVCVW